MRRAAAIALIVAALPARAERPALRLDVGRDLAISGGAAAVWLGTELAKPALAPARCRWCGVDALDVRARNALVLGYVDTAARTSDVLAFAVLPAGVVAQAFLAARAGGDPAAEAWKDLLVVGEAVALTGALTQGVKLAAGRQRPYARYGDTLDGALAPEPDDDLSFWSGHTATAFALATAAGTVSFLRGDGDRGWVLGVGLGLAATTGYLRIAADRHWLTDVLAGAAAGAAVGWAVPWLLHRPTGPGAGAAPAAVTPLPVGVAIAF